MSAYPVGALPHETFYEVLAGRPVRIPVQIFWMLAIVIVGTLVFRRTTFGYWVQATGATNGGAPGRDPVRRVKVICFVLSALSAAFAGALSFAHLTSVSPTAGAGDELTVIAAVVIGRHIALRGPRHHHRHLPRAALLTIVRNGTGPARGARGDCKKRFWGNHHPGGADPHACWAKEVSTES
jgi:ribose/xylose/arabinose/galactoside ABC-type transport system permease subunit